MVETVHFIASEHQFMEFEQIVTVFIYIHLQIVVKRVWGKLVVVRKGYDVVVQFQVVYVGFGSGVVAFVENAVYTGMHMEVGSFPTMCAVEVAVWIEYVGSAERLWFRKIVYRAYACSYNGHCGYNYDCRNAFQQYAEYFP